MTAIRPDGTGEIRVLAIDGGGVRGLIPATLIAHIEKEVARPISDTFNVLAGTSTGALIVSALSRPHSVIDAETMRRFYEEEPLTIFPRRRRLSQVRARPKRQSDFDQALQTVLGGLRVADCATEILIPAFDTLGHEAVLCTREGAKAHSPEATLMEVVLASSAAPTYLPPIQMRWGGQDRLFVDGGVFANDPSLATITALRARYPRRPISVLSLGCGVERRETGRQAGIRRRAQSWLLGEGADKTMAGWMHASIGLFMDASSSIAGQASENLLGNRILRVQPVFEPGERPELDEASTIVVRRLKDAAHRCWENEREEVLRFLTT